MERLTQKAKACKNDYIRSLSLNEEPIVLTICLGCEILVD